MTVTGTVPHELSKRQPILHVQAGQYSLHSDKRVIIPSQLYGIKFGIHWNGYAYKHVPNSVLLSSIVDEEKKKKRKRKSSKTRAHEVNYLYVKICTHHRQVADLARNNNYKKFLGAFQIDNITYMPFMLRPQRVPINDDCFILDPVITIDIFRCWAHNTKPISTVRITINLGDIKRCVYNFRIDTWLTKDGSQLRFMIFKMESESIHQFIPDLCTFVQTTCVVPKRMWCYTIIPKGFNERSIDGLYSDIDINVYSNM
jgi:hypothetical protein